MGQYNLYHGTTDGDRHLLYDGMKSSLRHRSPETLLSPSWTEDTLLDGRVILKQPKKGYRVTFEPVLLASAVPAQPGDWIADVGTGTGAAALCLLARVPESKIFGVEIQKDLAHLANINGVLNSKADRFQIIVADVLKSAFLKKRTLATRREMFDHVMSNPPFAAAGTPSSNPMRATAYHAVNLQSWIAFCMALLRPQGSLTLLYRADKLDRLLASLTRVVGGIEIIPLWPRAGHAARRLIVRGRKGSQAPSILHAGLILHTATGYTVEAERLLRKGHALQA